MGLDNGFTVRGINKEDIPKFIEMPDNEYEDGSFDIAYYRKCWGIRNAILEVLHQDEENAITKVDAEDIPAIIRAIIPFFSKEYWVEHGESIWEFEEAIEFTLIQQTLNLKWLYYYMLEHPEVTCEFYDSF